jgi:hypothetical protein
VLSLFEFPKVAQNSSTNVSKSFSNGDWCSNKNINHMLKLCFIARCQWDQLGLHHLASDVGAIEWLNALGWEKLETLNVFC